MSARLRFRDDAADDRMAGTPSPRDYLPQLLLYPLTGFCLPIILTIAAFVALGTQSLLGIPLLAITGIWMVHYLTAVIEHTSRGHATPPPLAADVVFLGIGKIFRALCGPALVLWAYFGLRGPAPLAAELALALGGFLAPAYLFSLALDGSLLCALNPLRLLQIVLSLGVGYLLPCAVLAVGAAALGVAGGTGSVTVVMLVFCYLLFLTAHLLGFVAYHRRDALGLQVHVGDPDEKQRVLEQSARLDAVVAAIDARLNDHDLDGAARALLDEPGGPADVIGFHEDLFRKLSTRGEPGLLHAQGCRLIGVLLDARRDARALEVYEACVNRHAAFEPTHAPHWLRLAQEAHRAGLDRRFEELAESLARHHPDHSATTSAQFLRARWHAEKRDEARARELLRPLLTRKNHPEHAQIVALARMLAPRAGTNR